MDPVCRGREPEALIQAARDGDSAAADRLYEIAGARLTRIALALAIPPDEVEDVVQEVLLSAWRNLDRFDPRRGTFVGWLVPGLRGRARNRLRARARRRRFLRKLGSLVLGRGQGEEESSDQDAVEARLTLEGLLGRLTERQREVVALYEIEGLSARETAELLGISEAGVRSVARDARRRLEGEARSSSGKHPGALRVQRA